MSAASLKKNRLNRAIPRNPATDTPATVNQVAATDTPAHGDAISSTGDKHLSDERHAQPG